MYKLFLLLLISAAPLLSGCQTAGQKFEIVNVSDILPTAPKSLHDSLTKHEKWRAVTISDWICYVPDDKPFGPFFCVDKIFNSFYSPGSYDGPDKPTKLPDSHEDGHTAEHPHHH